MLSGTQAEYLNVRIINNQKKQGSFLKEYFLYNKEIFAAFGKEIIWYLCYSEYEFNLYLITILQNKLIYAYITHIYFA